MLVVVNILAIGAHPDDIELGCAGLLLKAARQGHKVFMYILTRGSASGDAEVRTKEAIHSSKIIGATRLWIDTFDDTHLSVNSDLINHIEFFINKAEADIVITHSPSDTHHDHRAVATSTIEAGRFIANLLSYEIPLTKEFKPQLYYDISDVVDDKVKIIKGFWSQETKLYLKANAIKGLAQYRSLQSRQDPSINYVEAFEVLKLCIDKDLKLWRASSEEIFKNQLLESNLKQVLEFAYDTTMSVENTEDLYA